jgi:ribA/ribD-fused uncharacterized protein
LVHEFRDGYGFLSNDYEFGHPIEVPGAYAGDRPIPFHTVSHAFLAASTDDRTMKVRIASVGSAAAAAKILQPVEKIGWAEKRDTVMRNLLIRKFASTDLKSLLLGTGGAVLIHGNVRGDRYWGAVPYEDGDEIGMDETVWGERWVGQNKLGRLLMELRAEWAA